MACDRPDLIRSFQIWNEHAETDAHLRRALVDRASGRQPVVVAQNKRKQAISRRRQDTDHGESAPRSAPLKGSGKVPFPPVRYFVTT